jgi:hypothetical protein
MPVPVNGELRATPAPRDEHDREQKQVLEAFLNTFTDDALLTTRSFRTRFSSR